MPSACSSEVNEEAPSALEDFEDLAGGVLDNISGGIIEEEDEEDASESLELSKRRALSNARELFRKE